MMFLMDKLTPDVTTNVQLTDLGNMMFPAMDGHSVSNTPNFLGAHCSDVHPELINNNDCMILNTKTCKDQGEHWTALYRQNNRNYWYDSFGRDPVKLSPYFSKDWIRVITSPKHRDQSYTENNCGDRCLAFIVAFAKYGPKCIDSI